MNEFGEILKTYINHPLMKGTLLALAGGAISGGLYGNIRFLLNPNVSTELDEDIVIKKMLKIALWTSPASLPIPNLESFIPDVVLNNKTTPVAFAGGFIIGANLGDRITRGTYNVVEAALNLLEK